MKLMLNKCFHILGKKLSILITCIIITLLLALAFFPQLSNPISYAVDDIITYIYSHFRKHNDNIFLISIDTESLKSIPYRWPWPRKVIAELLKKITSQNPKVVIFDIIFQHPEINDPQGDEEFIKIVKQAGNVAGVSIIEEILTEKGLKLQYFGNYPKLQEAYAFEGFVWTKPDSDGVIRSFYLTENRLGIENIVLKAANFIGNNINNSSTNIQESLISEISFPPMYPGYQQISAKKVLFEQIPANLFTNKIILIGGTAPVLHDFHQTPLGPQPGVSILAAKLETVLNKSIVLRIYNKLWIYSSVLLGYLLGFILPTLFTKWNCIKTLVTGYFMTFFIKLLLRFVGYSLPIGSFCLSWSLGTIVFASIKYFTEIVEIANQKAEAAAASRIQNRLFPAISLISERFFAKGISYPCMIAGGDWFELYQDKNSNIFFSIGDVTGHGFAANSISIIAKSIGEYSRHLGIYTLNNYLIALNAVIIALLKKQLQTTAIVGKLDTNTNTVDFAMAGHLFPVKIKANGEIQEIKGSSLPLGVKSSPIIAMTNTDILPGERIVLFSDGITEALDWEDNQYGFDRWYSFLKNRVPSFSPSNSIEELLVDVKKHVKERPFEDDVTLIILGREA